ncbi:MAG: hypothetical protein ACE5FO_12510 [Parvularculaceae bacterium]
MSENRDLASRPVPFFVGWGLPIVIAASTNFIAMPVPVLTLIWIGAFVWMGLGCLINARRCHRRHCYYSGPVLLLGAVAVALVGFRVVSLGPDGFMIAVWGTFGLVALTFVPELIWGKYVSNRT